MCLDGKSNLHELYNKIDLLDRPNFSLLSVKNSKDQIRTIILVVKYIKHDQIPTKKVLKNMYLSYTILS